MTNVEDFVLIEKVKTNVEDFVLIEKIKFEQFEIIEKTYFSEPFWGKVVNKN